MRKILIIGGSGAGKSTLARQLGDILHIPVHHLDAIFWKPGWQPIERADLISEQKRIIQNEAWIIDGNYSATMDIRLKEADTVVFLHYKTIRCLYGVLKRRIQYHGKTRPDMGQDCPEKLDIEFIQWVYQFNRKKAKAIYEKLNQLSNTTIHIFTTPKQTHEFVTNLMK
ncbi:DNA topology modulation protein [Virgibacillus oceani]|uniref:Topology modulation protein n=1 Tax=Virgibacillus oceani TaxID=1479511 RepID=A0A917HQU0_9BACI|nr:DNA topology modulation protein [Virgibacillus oceani]GGG86570.1 topology modulation protein [Virgibacillus oceani]